MNMQSCWRVNRQKSMSHRFSVSPELMTNFVIVPEDWKSAWHCFFCAHTPTGGMSPYCITKYLSDCEIWDLNSQYFIFYMQTRVCAEYTPKLGSVLRRHGFGWQIRNTGSLDPIFHSQTGLGTSSGRGYRLFVPDSIKIIFCLKFQILIIFENKKKYYFFMVKIHTFHCKYMTQYTPTLLDIPLNETPSTLKPCHLITGIPNFIENACNVSVISTIWFLQYE